MAQQKLFTKSQAQVLSDPHKSRPMWEGRSPRWICQFFMKQGCVPVTGGIYRINKVTEPFIPIQSATGSNLTDLPKENLNIIHSHNEGTTIGNSYAAYDTAPKEVHLQSLQTVVKMHTRIPTLYSNPQHNQLEAQIALSAEWMYESKENLIFHHPDYGLLNNVAPKLQINHDGAPTPQLFDEMLSRVWKMPDIFVAHPEAIQAFCDECNKQGLVPQSTEMFGSAFISWRGIPILPTNKLYLKGGKGQGFSNRGESSKTTILLMRVGEEKQGVISLYAAGTEGSPRYPFITVDFMNISDESVSSYLLTMYAAMAKLTDGALCSAEVTI